MCDGVRQILKRRDLFLMLVSRNLKIRYKHTALGFFWSLLGPLFLIAIYALFLRVMRFNVDLPVLVTGIITWQFHALCLGDALHAILGNSNLVTKAAFPRIILPLATVTANLLNFLLAFVVLLVYLAVVRADFGALYWLPAIVVTQFALALGMSLLVSAANVFFRDTEHILSVVMLAWFFLTPVIYPVSLVLDAHSLPSWAPVAFFANPMTGLVSAYRAVLLSNPLPGLSFVLLSGTMAWLILVVGWLVFQACEKRFGDEL